MIHRLEGYRFARKSANDLDQQARDALRSTDLTPPLFDLLLLLTDRNLGQARLSSVAIALGITTGGATRLVQRAAGAGLVTCLPVPDDRRGSTVAITQSGRQQYELALPLMVDSFVAVVS